MGYRECYRRNDQQDPLLYKRIRYDALEYAEDL